MKNNLPSDLEERIGLATAARLPELLIEGRSPSPATLWRWIRVGILADDGSRIFLRHTKVGFRISVSRADVREFVERCAASRNVPTPAADQAARAREFQAARETLASRGMIA